MRVLVPSGILRRRSFTPSVVEVVEMGRCVVDVAGMVVVLVLALIVVGGLRVMTDTTPDTEPSSSVTPASTPERDSDDVPVGFDDAPPLDGVNCFVPPTLDCFCRLGTFGTTVLATVVEA
jgi:hypothetical protein